jgi:biopolymer transport protein ExbD
MAMKKRSKAIAEFSMSSLTDIIFLLLVFFMLTATFVNVKKLQLPQSDNKTVAPSSLSVSIQKNGTFSVNGKDIPSAALKPEIRQVITRMGNQENATITIIAEVGVPFTNVMKVLGVANELKMKAILATQPRS